MRKFLTLLCIALPLCAQTFIPDSTTVRSMGRVQWSSENGATYDWSGTRFDFSFTGTSLALRFNDANNHYEIYLNGVKQPRLKTIWGDSTYIIAENLDADTHSVRIERRTEQHWGKASFKEIILDESGELLPAPSRPKRRFMLLGDSFTTGYGCEHPTQEGDAEDFVNTTNTAIAFGSLVGKHFEADYQTLGFSGKGLIRNASADSPGKEYRLYYDHLFTSDINHDSASTTKWDHANWKPQIIAVHLGLNDFNGDKVKPADTAKWRAEYQIFIDTLLQQYPQASIIVMSTGDWPHGLLRASAKEVVSRAQAADKAVYLYDYSVASSALHWHPSVSEQKQIADGLIELITEKKLWEKTAILPQQQRMGPKGIKFHLIHNNRLRISGIRESKATVSLYTPSGKKLQTKEVTMRKDAAFVSLKKYPQRPLIVEVKTESGTFSKTLLKP